MAGPTLQLVAALLKGRCPRCGAASLFDRFANFAPACPACGLDLASFNVGDGPAAFLILIVGTLMTGLAIWLELAVGPPFWIHILLWVPLTALAVLTTLRAAKAMLLTLEYRNSAREGRLSDR